MTILLLATIACKKKASRQSVITYPDTPKTDHVDNYFGTEVADPYRWLENDTAPEVEAWVVSQNEVTDDYLNRIPYQSQIRERLEDLYNYEKYSAPRKEGGRYFFFKNDGLQNQSVLYVQQSLDSEPEIFLDPNTLSEDGTIALSGISFSRDGAYMAYAITESGSDWRTIYVMEVESKQLLNDVIQWAKFTGISWAGKGFYYSSYDRPEEGLELSSVNNNHKVYYHQLGTDQSEDRLVYGHPDQGEDVRYAQGYVSENEKYLFVSGAQRTNGNSLYFKSLESPEESFIPLVEDFDHNYYVFHTAENTLYVLTDDEAPNGRIITIDTRNPEPQNWKTLIPEQDEVIEGAGAAGGKLFLTYLKDASSHVFQYDLDGSLERDISLPELGTAYGFDGKKEDKQVFYTFTSFTYPPTIFSYDIETGESTLFRRPVIDFALEDYTTEQVFYESKDGTQIPMFLVYRKDLQKDGSNPTYLYSYGGFNISLTPNFSTMRLAWLEQGGIFAMPNIRGGGEYGKKWHEAGIKMNKQNVFDDFIAAAEFLIQEKYTAEDKLAILGGSNGGLLVGAAMTQRPELFKVAVPAVGVMDMLRYHKFTAGAGWTYDYGCADSSREMFEYIYAYSPLHNIRKGVSYPATLVKTADHDDRVVPAHSFKFISELQDKHKGENPVLIRIETKAGHGGGKPTAKILDEWADTYAFVFGNLGISYQKPQELTEDLPPKYD